MDTVLETQSPEVQAPQSVGALPEQPPADSAAAVVPGPAVEASASEAAEVEEVDVVPLDLPARAPVSEIQIFPDAPEVSLRGKVEALLFASPAPLRIFELCKFLDKSKSSVKRALDELIADLNGRNGALTVTRQGSAYSIVLKSDYQEIASLFMPPELEPASLKTLSVIAVNQPLTQSKLVELRGSTAYEHVKGLLEKGYVKRRRDGNTYILRTTRTFAIRFRVEDDPEKIREAMLQLERRSAELAALVEPDAVEEAPALSEEQPPE
ncbi:MAG: SMC-Scp complex subunit ScpB [Candidatus Wallbacteria bacterium]|nr:SMC-Scp complex subunit ScpB [Candidatus Wallbacteria bacterium]